MNEELSNYEMALREAELRAESEKVRNMQNENILSQTDKSMIQEQLSLDDELERIDFLLRGYTLEKDSATGENKWVAPTDNEHIILSPYGVHLIRNTIAWYIHKDTLLSNYDDKTILNKMADFASDLNDTIFMEYEKVFQYPSFEDCKKILNERVQNKKNLKIFAKELLGKTLSDEEKAAIESKILADMEPIIERELEKIKQQVLKNKLKRFMLLVRCIQDIVHSTYLRAFNGIERKTLREHITISEQKGTMPTQQKGGMLNSLLGR